MRHTTLRVSVLFAALMTVLPLRAAPLVLQAEDLGSLGGSPFTVRLGKIGRNGTLPGSTQKPGTPNRVPFAWTAANGFRVISNEPGIAVAANGVGQVTGVLQHES